MGRLLFLCLLMQGCATVAVRPSHELKDSNADGSDLFCALFGVCAEPAAPEGPPVDFADLKTDVNEESVKAVMTALSRAEKAGFKTFTLTIDSPGGDVWSGLDLVHAIEDSPLKVTCLVRGKAASMAMVVFQSCDQRLMTSESVLMGHEAASGGSFGGKSSDWRNVAERLRALSNALATYQCKKIKLPFAECRAKVSNNNEWWLDAVEALEVGAADIVVESHK